MKFPCNVLGAVPRHSYRAGGAITVMSSWPVGPSGYCVIISNIMKYNGYLLSYDIVHTIRDSMLAPALRDHTLQ